jgi:hypothetical protein
LQPEEPQYVPDATDTTNQDPLHKPIGRYINTTSGVMQVVEYEPWFEPFRNANGWVYLGGTLIMRDKEDEVDATP